MKKIVMLCFSLTIIFQQVAVLAIPDPLPSWNNGPLKHKIIQFVQSVTDKKNPNYTPREERIAVFDNDGTLITEQPFYAQGFFAIDQIKNNASHHPEWYETNPYKKILETNHIKLSTFTPSDFETILKATHAGMTIDAFQNAVVDWLNTAIHPTYHRSYTRIYYQPMLEVMNFLRANQFDIYIVSGSGQEFLRPLAEKIYQIHPNHVIGTLGNTVYSYQDNIPQLIKQPSLLLMDDKDGKVIAIHFFIGQHPMMAFGNSDGDRQMLEWTESRKGPHFVALVHHDDAKREYAYDTPSSIGQLSENLMKEAIQHHWNVISMRQDWKIVFPDDIH